MARTSVNTKEKQEHQNEQVNNEVVYPADDTEKDQLRQEVNQLKEMMQSLLASLSTQQNESVVQNEIKEVPYEEEAIEIQPGQLIKVTSLFYGGMVLRGANNKRIPFDKFGVTLPVTFEDLNYICNNHRKLAEEGCFYIHDKKAIKALYLEENYKKIVNKETIESIIALSEKQITDIVSNLTPSLLETIEDIVIEGIINNDRRYADRNKIDIIGKLCKKDLYNIAHSRIVNK